MMLNMINSVIDMGQMYTDKTRIIVKPFILSVVELEIKELFTRQAEHRRL